MRDRERVYFQQNGMRDREREGYFQQILQLLHDGQFY